jgi:hypothetical protein
MREFARTRRPRLFTAAVLLMSDHYFFDELGHVELATIPADSSASRTPELRSGVGSRRAVWQIESKQTWNTLLPLLREPSLEAWSHLVDG